MADGTPELATVAVAMRATAAAGLKDLFRPQAAARNDLWIKPK
jgi:hypothetical protein